MKMTIIVVRNCFKSRAKIIFGILSSGNKKWDTIQSKNWGLYTHRTSEKCSCDHSLSNVDGNRGLHCFLRVRVDAIIHSFTRRRVVS